MNERLRHPFLLRSLETASRLLAWPLFAPLHIGVQIVHHVLTAPSLCWGLRLVNADIVDVKLRRSVRRWGDYHVLLSDLDVTIIIRSAEVDMPKLSRHLEKLRSVLVFIGEYEIYTASEFTEKTVIEADLGFFFEFVRNLRKLSWLSPSVNRYHRLKYEIATSKLDRKIRRAIASDFDHQWRQAVGPHELSFGRLDARMRGRLDGFLHEAGSRYLQHPKFECFLRLLPLVLIDSGYDGLSNEALWLALLFNQHERLMTGARLRWITDPSERSQLATFNAELESECVRIKSHLAETRSLLSFEIYGVGCEVHLSHQAVDQDLQERLLERLEQELRYFSNRPLSGRADVVIYLRADDAWADDSPVAAPNFWPLTTSLGRMSWKRGRRWVQFEDGSLFAFSDIDAFRRVDIVWRGSEKTGRLENLLHSSIGERLERRGFFRLHALGYRDAHNHAVIEIGNPGSGKSLKALRLLDEPSCQLYGDEVVLVKGGHVFPYPSPIAVIVEEGGEEDRAFKGRRKRLIAIPSSRVAAPQSIDRLVFRTKSRLNFVSSLEMMISLGLGLGLPQMKEYVVRGPTLTWLFRLFCRRLALARALRHHRHFSFYRDRYFK